MLKRNRDIERRSRVLKDGRRGQGPVIHWLERDQRLTDNWALLWAQQEALAHERPLRVVFCFDRGRPGVGRRSALFELAGIEELQKALNTYHIDFSVLVGAPALTLPALLHHCDAHVLTTDFNPLRDKRQQLEQVIAAVHVPVIEIDAHNIIPAWLVSDKQEYAAYTIRPKINRLLDDYLTDFPPLIRHPYGPEPSAAPVDTTALLNRVADRRATGACQLEPGERAARTAMETALTLRLPHYEAFRNDPCQQAQSDLSPYFHCGQLAPQRMARSVADSNLGRQNKDAFLEELIVRRELADNFCYFQPDYDRFAGFPAWGRKTLDEHRNDERTHRYSLSEFEQAKTHEPLWNACQLDLVRYGKLHGYLRMYWAKKILEWSETPEEALEYGIVLNDRYSLDGCDPNGYTGVAWSIGGVHDRAWPERPVFGKIRYMNENGCRRKFSVDAYITGILNACADRADHKMHNR